MMVSWTGVARACCWVRVLDCAEKVEGAVGSCGSQSNVETHCSGITKNSFVLSDPPVQTMGVL